MPAYIKKWLKFFGIAAVAALIALYAFLFIREHIGVTKESIEKDARHSQHIDDDWLVSMETTDVLSAMIFYPDPIDLQQTDQHTFSIYTNNPGFSFGYHFSSGGSSGSLYAGVQEFYRESYSDRAFLSMNKQQICKAEIDDGTRIKTIPIDSQKPFVIVFPARDGNVTFYDINGHAVQTGRL